MDENQVSIATRSGPGLSGQAGHKYGRAVVHRARAIPVHRPDKLVHITRDQNAER